MPLPSQIARQAEEADRILHSMSGQPEGEQPQTEQEPEPTQQTTVAEETPQTETSSEAESKPRKPKPFERDDDDAWKARYYSLQGTHKALLAQRDAKIDELSERLKTLEAKQAQPASNPQPKARVTEKEVEAFGADLIDVIDRKAQEVADARVASLESVISRLEQQLQTAQEKLGGVEKSQTISAEERFWSDLTKDVPDWNELQTSEDGQEFLGTKIPGTRATWDDALKAAAAAYDAKSAVEVFQEFLKRYPQYDKKARARNQQQTRDDLNKHVAPSKSQASQPTSTNKARVYTVAEFQAESNRIIQLAKAGRHDEAAALEAELDAAVAQGRLKQ